MTHDRQRDCPIGTFPTVHAIVDVHDRMTELWHAHPVNNSYEGMLGVVCEQHSKNFLLWHEEDQARCPQASDETIADVKRAIDRLNQQRNDQIEQIDQAIATHLHHHQIKPISGARTNTETIGSAIDRLSIMSLRIYHLDEQLQRSDIDTAHRQQVGDKLQIAVQQRTDLAAALEQLIIETLGGRCCHRTYRGLKMYNDPKLNPFLYRASEAA